MNTMKKILGDKRYTGILLAIILGTIFILISLGVMNLLSGVPWYLFSSALRIIFGVVILILVKKIYGKSPKEMLAFSNVKVAIISTVEVLEHNKKDLERLLHNERSAKEKAQEQNRTHKRNNQSLD